MCVGRAVRTLCGGGGQEELCASRLLQAAEHAACLRREEGAWALCGDALAGSPSVTIQSGAAPYVGLRLGSRHTGAHISPGGGGGAPPAWPFALRRSGVPLGSFKAVANVSCYLT